MIGIFKKAATSVVSPIWCSVNGLARPLYRKNAMHFPVPVISIGNIVAGGVGKTEITIVIANHLIRSGKKVAVSMRGYGSEWGAKEGVSAKFEEALSLKFPDEALVLLKKVPGVIVCVGKNRSKVLAEHFEKIKPGVILLEDGYQHFKIHRDLDVLVHDFSIQDHYFRDLPSHFEKVKVRISFSEVPEFWKQIGWIEANYQIKNSLPSSAVAFCGIGNPERFEKKLQSSGVELLRFLKYVDHMQYDSTELRKILHIANSFGSATVVLTTWKDYVKCMSILNSNEIKRITPIEIDVSFKTDPNHLWKAIHETLAITAF